MSAQSPSAPEPLPPKAHGPGGKTRLAKKVDRLMTSVLEPIDVVGKHLLGEWWRQIVAATQDAIAISVLLLIPSWIFETLDHDFSTLGDCWDFLYSANIISWSTLANFDPKAIACTAVIAADCCFWLLFFGRTIARFLVEATRRP